MDHQPTPNGPARERVYAYVSEQILRGRFEGGSFIEEEQISSALDVSRTPVREAFHRLEAEKFIELLPRRGAMVRQVTAQDLIDLYDTRRVIEAHAIERICRSEFPIPESMGDCLAEMTASRAVRHDVFSHVLLDRRFHREMVVASCNAIMTELYDTLQSRQLRVAMAALSVDPGRIDKIIAEHETLLGALRSYDQAAALAAIDEHLRPVFGVMSKLPGFESGTRVGARRKGRSEIPT